MNVRWMVALALALVIAAWFFATRLRPESKLASAPESRPSPTAPPNVTPESRALSKDTVAPRTEIATTPAPVEPEADPLAPAAPAKESVLVYGVVQPIAGRARLESPVTVLMTDRLGKESRSETGPDGEYSFTNVASGRHWIIAQSMTEGTVRLTVDIDTAAGDRRLDLQLRLEHEVQVEMVDRAGEPIQGVAVLAVATLEPPGEWFDEVQGSWNNTFGVGAWWENGFGGPKLPDPVVGRIRLTVPPPVFVSVVHNQFVIATQKVELGQTRVRFVLDPQSPQMQQGRVRLRLIDAQTRQPLAGISMQCSTSSGMYFATTGADGVYSGRTMPGWLGVHIQSEQYESSELTLRVQPGVDNDFGDIAIEPAVAISGMVVDEEGQGVAQRMLYDLIEPSGIVARVGMQYSANSSADGSFRIDGLSRRRYCVRVSNRDSAFGVQAVIVDARAGSVEGIRVELARGTPLMVSASDDRWPLVRFSVFDALGAPLISASRLWGPEPRQILLAPGRYEMEVRIGDAIEGARRVFTVARDPIEMSLP